MNEDEQSDLDRDFSPEEDVEAAEDTAASELADQLEEVAVSAVQEKPVVDEPKEEMPKKPVKKTQKAPKRKKHRRW